jgi:hypothetical protein
MGLRFQAALALQTFEIFTFFVTLVIFGAPRHPCGAALCSPKPVIAAWGLSRKTKGHGIIMPGSGATLTPISGGNLGLHLPAPAPVTENRKSGVTRPWHGATFNILCNSGAVVT